MFEPNAMKSYIFCRTIIAF